MENVKNRLYNYETTPPEGVWQSIANELDRDEARVIPLKKKKNYTFYYIAAASVIESPKKITRFFFGGVKPKIKSKQNSNKIFFIQEI